MNWEELSSSVTDGKAERQGKLSTTLQTKVLGQKPLSARLTRARADEPQASVTNRA